MGNLSIQRQGEEVVIRLNIQDLDKTFLDKIGDLLFWESALRKAGFKADEIREILTVSKPHTRKKTANRTPLSDSEIQSWATKIEERWWEANADQVLEGINR